MAQITIINTEELHPLKAAQAYGWSDSEAAYFLSISIDSIRRYRSKTRSRRSPCSRTKQQTWDRVKNLIQQGIRPLNPELLPQSFQEYLN